jgi:hypothetical protein
LRDKKPRHSSHTMEQQHEAQNKQRLLDHQALVEKALSQLDDLVLDPELQQEACARLEESLGATADMVEALPDDTTARMTRVLLQLVNVHDRQQLQALAACGLLSKICEKSASCRKALLESEGVDVLLAFVGSQKDKADLDAMAQALGLIMRVCELPKLDENQERGLLKPEQTREITTLVVEAMARCTEAGFLMQGIRYLGGASKEETMAEDLMGGSIRTIIAAARLHADDVQLQACACKALSNLARQGDEAIKQMRVSGALRCITAAMDCILRKGAEQQTEADVAALIGINCRTICLIYQNLEGVQDEPGISVMVRAMEQLSSNEAVQFKCLGALAFCAELSKKNAEALGIHALEAILAAMKNHPTNAKLQERGFAALQIICSRVKTSADWLVRAEERLRFLVQQVNMHLACAEVQDRAIRMFITLVAKPEHVGLGLRMFELGWIKAIVDAMNMHRDCQGRDDVLLEGLRALTLWVMTWYEFVVATMRQVVRFGAIATCVDAIFERKGHDSQVVHECACILINVTKDAVKLEADFLDEGFESRCAMAVLEAVRTHARSDRIQSLGINYVGILFERGPDEMQKFLLDQGATDVVLAALTCVTGTQQTSTGTTSAGDTSTANTATQNTIPKHSLQSEGSQGLVVLSKMVAATTIQMREHLVEKGYVQTVAGVMNMGRSSVALQHTGVLALHALGDVDLACDTRSRLVAQGAVDAVMHAMSFLPDDVEVQFYGAMFIACMLVSHTDNRKAVGVKVIPALVTAMKKHEEI